MSMSEADTGIFRACVCVCVWECMSMSEADICIFLNHFSPFSDVR